MLHHNKVPNLIINPSARKGLRNQVKASSELRKRIIDMKLSKCYSADIVAETGASESIIQKVWKDYRAANPSAEKVPTGNYKMVDKDRYVKKAWELI